MTHNTRHKDLISFGRLPDIGNCTVAMTINKIYDLSTRQSPFYEVNMIVSNRPNTEPAIELNKREDIPEELYKDAVQIVIESMWMEAAQFVYRANKVS